MPCQMFAFVLNDSCSKTIHLFFMLDPIRIEVFNTNLGGTGDFLVYSRQTQTSLFHGNGLLAFL